MWVLAVMVEVVIPEAWIAHTPHQAGRPGGYLLATGCRAYRVCGGGCCSACAVTGRWPQRHDCTPRDLQHRPASSWMLGGSLSGSCPLFGALLYINKNVSVVVNDSVTSGGWLDSSE